MGRRSSLFIYEHGVCEEKLPESIAVEGLAMFKSLLDFGRYYNLVSYVRDEFSKTFSFNCSSFDQAIEMADKALIIAPESDFTLLRITKEIEKRGIENLGSSSKAIEITSDKWRTYKKLKGRVNMPLTSKSEIEGEYVVKPRVSCGGDGIRIGGKVGEGEIAQELVRGKSMSFSFYVGDDINLLSINRQLLDGFSYLGSIIPEKADRDTIDEAFNAIDNIKGLRGYVGVDAVVGDAPYIIEVNARLTTPFIAFPLAYGLSYADMHHILSSGNKLSLKAKRRVLLKKSKGKGFVSLGDYSIILKTI